MKPTSAHAATAATELHNPGVAHETSDVNVRAILWFAAIVAVTTAVCAVIVWGLFDCLDEPGGGARSEAVAAGDAGGDDAADDRRVAVLRQRDRRRS